MVTKLNDHAAFLDVVPRKVDVGPPLSWLVESIGLVRKHWKIVIPAYMVVALLPQTVQFGILALNSRMGLAGHIWLVLLCFVLTMVFYGGMMAMFHGIMEKRPHFKDVFSGVSLHGIASMTFLPVLMAVAGFIIWIFCVAVLYGFDVGSVFFGSGAFRGSWGSGLNIVESKFMLALVVVLGLGLVASAVLGALFCFVVPLAIVSGMGVSSAAWTSLKACLKNPFAVLFLAVNGLALAYMLFLPAVILGIASTSLGVLSIIVFLAILILGAVMSGAHYLAFRDVFLVNAPSDASSLTT